MNPLRSVGARLGLGLALVVAGALVLVDLIVVPSLERNLIDSKVSQLREAAPAIANAVLNSTELQLLDDACGGRGERERARRLLHAANLEPPKLLGRRGLEPGHLGGRRGRPGRAAGAHAYREARQRHRDCARAALRRGRLLRPRGPVVLLRSSLHDSLQSIHLVRRRLVIAGLIALVASLLVGYVAATLFARRIRRLERAADRIAAGDFSEPVADSRQGRARSAGCAFEEMRQRLAQLEHARREFIANASHELRTPLFSLGGFLEIMTDEELDPETQAEFMATMREQVDRLTKLATDLLDLSRLDAGRLTVEQEHVDLAASGGGAGGRVPRRRPLERPRARGRERRGDPPRSATRSGRSRSAASSSRTPSSTRRTGTPVRIRTAQRNGSALLTVEDEGPGIPAEHAAHVFERFYRLDGSIASGSGLGLAIATELAELMGGPVELHVIPGRTIFALVLPTAASGAGVFP